MVFYKTPPPPRGLHCRSNLNGFFFEVERRHTKQRERLFNVTTISFMIIIVKYEHLRFKFWQRMSDNALRQCHDNTHNKTLLIKSDNLIFSSDSCHRLNDS